MNMSRQGVPEPLPTNIHTVISSRVGAKNYKLCWCISREGEGARGHTTRVSLCHFFDEVLVAASHHRATNRHQEVLVSALDKRIHSAQSMCLRKK